MQIALTKKLADAMKIKPQPATEEEKPLFTWTANWINTWTNRKAEDMLLLVNHANRFPIVIYQVKRKDLKKAPEIMEAAIRNTLLAMDVEDDIVEEYMKQAREIKFVKNTNRNATAWISQAGKELPLYVAHLYNGVDKMFNDTIGASVSHVLVSHPESKEYIQPGEEMVRDLNKFIGKSL